MPLSVDHQYLRLSQLPELLNRLTHNVSRKQTNIALYEAGSIFLNEEENIETQPEEQMRLSAALTGLWVDHKRSEEHTSELQSRGHLVCRLLLAKQNNAHTLHAPPA